MQDLGNAINESLSDSDRIAEAIGEIKKSGYDVFLVLEATIGFNKRDDLAMDLDDAQTGIEQEESAPQRILGPLGKVRWTSQDQKFLKALKISTDEHSD
jgi:hypothetical protein